MEIPELTEDQFKVIKYWVNHKTLIISCVVPYATDPETPQKAQLLKNLEILHGLKNAGLLNDLTDQLKEGNEYAQITGGQTFELYEVNEAAFQLFGKSGEDKELIPN